MIAAGINSGKDFQHCKITINKLQAAISWKKQKNYIFNRRGIDNEWVFSF
jgi:hypothetical protein